jgi:SAM-dependent methyltransferase
VTDRERWERRWSEERKPGDPSAWVMDRCRALPADVVIVDLASGSGRHAIPLAAAGRALIAVDFVERAVRRAARSHATILGVTADLAALPFRSGSLDAILISNFLERDLFPHYADLLRPGGWLIVETYSIHQLSLRASGEGHGPRNPSYLLQPGELARLVAPLVVEQWFEGEVHDGAGARAVTRVVARKVVT